MPKNLFKEFEDWLSYNFPGTKLTLLQKKVLRITLEGGLPRTDKELTAKLKRSLPKVSKPRPKAKK